MSGQTIFENPVGIETNSCCIKEIKKSIASKLRLSDAFRDIVTREEAEGIVKDAISEDAELVDYHIRQYSEEKLGFLGAHLCMIVDTKKRDCSESEKTSFFVKSLPYDLPSHVEYVEEKGCFRKEADFFRFLVPLMSENYKGVSWAPKCYLAKRNALVFENLNSKGFVNRAKLFDEKTMKSAVACIARFHACSLMAEEKLNGKRIDELYPDVIDETEFKRTGRSYEWFSNATDLAVALAEELNLDSSFVREACDRVFDICVPSKNKRNVISHGDLWSSNMLFDTEDNCNLVDFQLVRYAPLAHDLMQLIYLTSSREFRAKHERRMVEHYYATLLRTLTTNSYRGIVPSYMELLQGVEEQRLPALVTALIFHPTVLMDGVTAAKIMNDPVNYESYYFQNRKPFVDDIFTKDAEYKKRILDNVEELVEMSMILDGLPRPT